MEWRKKSEILRRIFDKATKICDAAKDARADWLK